LQRSAQLKILLISVFSLSGLHLL